MEKRIILLLMKKKKLLFFKILSLNEFNLLGEKNRVEFVLNKFFFHENAYLKFVVCGVGRNGGGETEWERRKRMKGPEPKFLFCPNFN